MAGKGTGSGHLGKPRKSREEDLLLDRYRAILVDKLTVEDLQDLQVSLRNQFDENGDLDPEYKKRFEGRLRRYLPEEVLTREIIGIEALVRSMRPEDLKGRHTGGGQTGS